MKTSTLTFEFPSVHGRLLTAVCDGGDVTSDAGVLLVKQVDRRLGLLERMAAGMWIHGYQSVGPASSRITDAPVSDRRDATTHPAEPAPTTT